MATYTNKNGTSGIDTLTYNKAGTYHAGAGNDTIKINGEKMIELPCYDMLKYNSFEFELYINRIFRTDYEEYVDETGKIYIKPSDSNKIDWENDTFLFHIFYLITQSATIIRTTDTLKVEDDKDKFRIFLSTEFINKYQWMKLREDSKLIL